MCQGVDKFRYTDHKDDGLWKCSGCPGEGGDPITLVAAVLCGGSVGKAVTLLEKIADLHPAADINALAKKKDDRIQFHRQAVADIRESLVRATEVPAVAAYLAGRGIALRPPAMRALHRFAMFKKKELLGFFPAMVWPVWYCGTTDLAGFHVTVIDPATHQKLAKKMYGLNLDRPVEIRIYPATGRTLAVAEGIENALSYSQLHRIPCWSAWCASGLEKWEPMGRDFRGVDVAGDNGRVGVKAAFHLVDRLREQGYQSQANFPDGEYADWNNELRKVSG